MEKELYTQLDFMNLTNYDIKNIIEKLDIETNEIEDLHDYIYQNLRIIEQNEEAFNIVSNKVLAGKGSLRWNKFFYRDQFTKERLKSELESEANFYNVTAKDRIGVIGFNEIVSIVKDSNIYTIKLLVTDGTQRVPDGMSFRTESKKKSAICKIDVDNCWVELRGNNAICTRCLTILENRLKLENMWAVGILDNFENDIIKLRDNLEGGFYKKYRAIPSENFELTEKDGIALGKIVDAVDAYFMDNDGDSLLDSLSKIDYDTEDLSLRNIILAGVGNVSMNIRPDSENDMASQGLYSILKEDLVEDNSTISFQTNLNGVTYTNTMQVYTKNNSIKFMNSVTEDVISYIRNKVLKIE